MSELLPILIPSIFLLFFSDALSTYNHVSKRYERKDKVFFYILAFSVAIFVGLRIAFNDTLTYVGTYNIFIPKNDSILDDCMSKTGRIQWLSLGSNPGFTFVQNIMCHLGFSSQDFLMCFALFSVVTYFWFIHKYTEDIFFSGYMFFTIGIFVSTMAAIKQNFAVAVGLIAIDRYLCGKKGAFFSLIIFASLFHPYILMFLFVPFLLFTPWERKTYIVIGAFVGIGLTLQLLIGRIIDFTTILGEDYTAESFIGEGVNPLRVLVFLVPLAVSFLVRKNVPPEFYDRNTALFVNLSMINGMLMFVALFGNAIYFGRLAQYFSLFSVLALPSVLKYMDERTRNLIKIIAIVLYCIFFVYELLHGYGARTFNDMFSRMKFFDYIETHIS